MHTSDIYIYKFLVAVMYLYRHDEQMSTINDEQKYWFNKASAIMPI